jgi:TM2 domain-containing membrane protein YozV
MKNWKTTAGGVAVLLAALSVGIKQIIAGDIGGAIAAITAGAGAMFTALKAQDAQTEDKK